MAGKVLIAQCLLLFLFINCRSESDTCLNLSTCGMCIQEPNCVWCTNPKDDKTNCREKNAGEEWCDKSDEVLPTASLSTTQNQDLSSEAGSPYVQMKPQRISLKVPRNQEHTIEFQFSRAENPLDLYFLMDASFTMKPYKATLATLGKDLVEAIANQTTDFRIGFGSFVDKTVFPFDYPEIKVVPCTDCARSYSFINHLSLTTDTSLFEQEVKNSQTSGNLDEPEGGLEALMQAIVCTQEIGWRQDATRLIVFSTDDVFHVAGDGRLAGIMFPNDGLCHVSEGMYTKDKEMDYPSVSHLSYKAKEHNIHIIFAIAGEINIQNTYRELSTHIDLSKYGTLSSNGAETIELLYKTYAEILRSVKITHNFPPEISVDFLAKCPNSAQTAFERGDSCSNAKVGEAIDFRAIIKPLQCLKPNEPKEFKIQAHGIHEGLTVDLEVICECDCERSKQTKPDESCNSHGYKVCGICRCDSGYTGRQCECSGTDTTVQESLCIEPETNKTCSGNGMCECGICKCERLYTGKFCSCENFSCPKNKNQLCSGKDHGVCECGECKCLPGWSGTDCACTTSMRQCIAPYSDRRVCSGKGECVCGICQCEKDYFGDFCEGCTGCEWCTDLDPCVEAYISKTALAEDKMLRINCSNVVITPQENATAGFYDTNWNKCLLPGNIGCKTVYWYKFGEKVLIEMGEMTCPFIASIQGLLLAILLPILVGGIFTFLAWKAIVTYKDKREFANFLKKKDQEKWNNDVNPLYKSAETTYQNPMFKKHA